MRKMAIRNRDTQKPLEQTKKNTLNLRKRHEILVSGAAVVSLLTVVSGVVLSSGQRNLQILKYLQFCDLLSRFGARGKPPTIFYRAD